MTHLLINQDERNGARKATEMILKRIQKQLNKIANEDTLPPTAHGKGYRQGCVTTLDDIRYDLQADLDNDTAGVD